MRGCSLGPPSIQFDGYLRLGSALMNEAFYSPYVREELRTVARRGARPESGSRVMVT